MSDSIKKNNPIKWDLFRFASLRGIKTTSQLDKEESFIHHPNISESHFIKNGVGSQEQVQNDQSNSNFVPIANPSELKKINEELFTLSQKVGSKQTALGMICDNREHKLPMLDETQQVLVWDLLFNELIYRKSAHTRTAIIQFIKTDYQLRNLKRFENNLTRLEMSKLLIPMEIIELIRLFNYKNCDGNLIGVTQLGIMDYRKVEQELCCYVVGKVSLIENTPARAYKEKHTRNLVSSEITDELTTELEIENLSDTNSTTRNELNTEIARVLNEERSTNYGGSLTVSGEKFGIKIDANAYADFSNSNSSQVSDTVAKNYAKEVTERALERIVQKTTVKKTSRYKSLV